jgi:hypothetical protein
VALALRGGSQKSTAPDATSTTGSAIAAVDAEVAPPPTTVPRERPIDAAERPSLLVREAALERLSGVLPELIEELTVKICIDPRGAVSDVDIPDDLAAEVRADVEAKLRAWRYRPFSQQGAAVAACAYVGVPAHEAGSGSAPVVVVVPPPKPTAGSAKPPAGSAKPPQGSAGSASQGSAGSASQGSAGSGSQVGSGSQTGSGSGSAAQGRLDPAHVEAALAGAHARLLACGARGRARVKITAAPSGAVTRAQAETQPKWRACIEGVLMTLTLPASLNGGTSVHTLRLEDRPRRPDRGGSGSGSAGSAGSAKPTGSSGSSTGSSTGTGSAKPA